MKSFNSYYYIKEQDTEKSKHRDRVKFYKQYFEQLAPTGSKIKLEQDRIIIQIKKVSE